MDTQAIIIAIIGSVFASQGFWTWLINRNNNKSAQARLIMGLGFSEIERKAKLYIEKGSISTDEYQDFVNYLYTPYTDMGGNGTAAKLMSEVDKLPIRKDGVK